MYEGLSYCDPQRVLKDSGPSGLSGLGVARHRTAAYKKPVELTPTAMGALGFEYRPRSFLGTASDERRDRYKDIVVQKGAQLEEYRTNPVLLWNHNRKFGMQTDDLPIGVNLAIWGETNRGDKELDRTRSIRHFSDETQRADEIYRLFKAGILRTTSIGFIPIQTEKMSEEEGGGLRFTEWSLREESVVNVPANIGATNEVRFDDGEMLEAAGGDVPLYIQDLENWLDTVKLGEEVELVPGIQHRADTTLRNGFETAWRGLRHRRVQVDTLIERVAELETTIEKLKAGAVSADPGDARVVEISIV